MKLELSDCEMTKSYLKRWYSGIHSYIFAELELRNMITEFDTDGSGSIEFNEFLQMMSKKMVGADGEFELKEAFKWVSLPFFLI